MRTARQIVQGAFLLFFLFLFVQTESKGADELGYPVKLFLDFDPLILVTTLLSAHAAAKWFYLSLIVIAATLLLGRVFCGWVCPLGTLNNMVGSLRRERPSALGPRWHAVKYYVLVFLLASSLFSLQLVGVVDPLSLLIRSLSLSVYPAFNFMVRALFDTLYGWNIPGVVEVSEGVYAWLRRAVLSFAQPSFSQGVLLGALFLVVLGLNLVDRRFWCRYLCPLGALLGVLSRFSLLKRSVSEGCTECGACEAACQGRANPDVKERWRDAECYYCYNCDDVCPEKAVRFGFKGPKKAAGLDLGRRRVVVAALSGVVAVPLARVVPTSRSPLASPTLIRPPGALEEREFLRRCVKCGECMKVCITNGLQPTLLEAGLEGIWSPLLVPRIGYCEYRCTLCGQVCPTGAIKRLGVSEKAKVKIGLAMIDKGRCLPYAHGIPCIVCEEVCPTPKKAIWFQKQVVSDREVREVEVQQPRVDLELCVGCGICETKCPVRGRPAIYVTNIGESRSRDNALLLARDVRGKTGARTL